MGHYTFINFVCAAIAVKEILATKPPFTLQSAPFKLDPPSSKFLGAVLMVVQ